LKQQIDACQNFAKAREWDVVEIFVEEGESAFRDGLKRPRLREMFGRVKSDGVERIIVWKFSRFARVTASSISTSPESTIFLNSLTLADTSRISLRS
jgi:DNA invertase Pin-like site-specific DNA recombinase